MQGGLPGFIESKSADAKAALVLVHGMGAHSLRWRPMMEYLNSSGFSSYAFDLPGFGADTGIKGHADSFKEFYESVRAAVATARGENPGKKIFLLGESMGGLIAFGFVAKYPGMADGLILISPAFAGRMKIPAAQVVLMLASLAAAPKKQFTMPFNSQMITGDPDMQKQLNDDPLEHRYATPKLLINIIVEQIRSVFLAKKVGIPVLFLLAGDKTDRLVDPRAAKRIFARLRHKSHDRLNQYREMGHALSIEKERETVFEDISRWVAGQTGGTEK